MVTTTDKCISDNIFMYNNHFRSKGSLPINKCSEDKQHGEYRTKRVILEIYDRMQKAIDTGQPYKTLLDPLPGPPTDAEGNFIPMAQWDKNNWPSHIHPPKEATK